jgi:hypothetical protein
VILFIFMIVVAYQVAAAGLIMYNKLEGQGYISSWM